MNAHRQEHSEPAPRDYRFVMGVLTGTVVGAGLALWFAPRLASELRQRITDSARDAGQRVTDGYEQVTSRITRVADDVTQRGQQVRDDVADLVAHGAHEVERVAQAAKTR